MHDECTVGGPSTKLWLMAGFHSPDFIVDPLEKKEVVRTRMKDHFYTQNVFTHIKLWGSTTCIRMCLQEGTQGIRNDP